MQYLFKSQIPALSNEEIFTGDNACGYVENNVLYINDKQYSYTYKNGEWYEKNFPCGDGRIPALNIENLKILDLEKWNSILYVPHEGEEN